MAKYTVHMAKLINAYKILVKKPLGKTPLGRPTCRLEDNFKMVLQEIVCKDVEWIKPAEDRVQ
jgi:hypothetical protein